MDEYQDINLGQQRFLELLASGAKADLMVVGDDDQTIYEWRGARPDYIIKEFPNVFDDKPHSAYKLTHSFRFGYQIAQCADNVLRHNANRTAKNTIAYQLDKPSSVRVIPEDPRQGETNRQLAEATIALVTKYEVPPGKIRVLGRTRAQMNELATEFLIQKIPFKVENSKPLFETTEVKTLLDYIQAASDLQKPLNRTIADRLLDIANRPNRKLSKRFLNQQIKKAQVQKTRGTTLEALTPPAADYEYQSGEQIGAQHDAQAMLALLQCLQTISKAASGANPVKASYVMEKARDATDLNGHYEEYYGPGQKSNDRISNMEQAIRYARQTDMTWPEFLAHLPQIDTKQGYPEDELIIFSTIHLVKGMEFEYVLLPNCKEGTMPVIASNEDPTYDAELANNIPSPGEWLEAERRLFYVAVTRARNTAVIGTQPLPGKTAKALGFDPVPNLTSEKSSRFIEEAELPVIAAADEALQTAMKGQTEGLALLSELHGSHHQVLNLIKQAYIHQLPESAQQAAANIKLAPAERSFSYGQAYNSPEQKAAARAGSETMERTFWQHLR